MLRFGNVSKKEQCELFVLYEVNDDRSKTVIWEDTHCGPGAGMTRMSRRIERRKLEDKFQTKSIRTTNILIKKDVRLNSIRNQILISRIRISC